MSFARFWRYCCARNWKTGWRPRSGSWNGPTSSGIWTTWLRWRLRSTVRATSFAARLLEWRARFFKHAASPCRPRCTHAELIPNSAPEKKRVMSLGYFKNRNPLTVANFRQPGVEDEPDIPLSKLGRFDHLG